MPRTEQIRWSQVKIGLVVSVALVMLTLAIMNMNHGLALLTRQVELQAVVSHTQGLKVGGPVRMNGVDIGNVRDIDLTHDSDAVRIVFTVKPSALAHLREDASVRIRALGLLGDKFLDLSPGTPSRPPLQPGQTLSGQGDADVTTLASGAGATLDRLDTAIAELQRILAGISAGQGTAGKLVSDPELYDRSQRLLEKLETASDKGLGLLGKVERGEGTVGKLVTDPEFYNRANRALNDVIQLAGRLNARDGTLVKLSDPTLYRRLDDLTSRGEQLLNRIQRGEGTIGKLVTEEELYARADKLLTDLEQLVADVKQHPTRYFKFSLF
ncbi:MlaD family protein [Candidatus Nitrospira bockiana]